MPKRSLKNTLQTFLSNSNLRLILLCAVISTYGCALVYSASYGAGSGWSGAIMQIATSIGGLLIAILLSQIDYEAICSLWPIWVGLSLILMLLTFTPLGINVPGTDDTAWLGFHLGGRLITFQPSELMKITFISTFSLHLSKVKDHLNRFSTVLLLGIHAAVPILLVFAQGDDGTALVFIMIFLGMMFAAGLNAIYYAIGFTAICAALPLAWSFFLTDDKKARILCILPPYIEKYLGTVGWQQFEGLKAIGSGRLTGVGYLQGGNGDLFARSNDLIFTVAGEEFGFIGALLLLLLLGALLFELLRCSMHARDDLGTYICIGMLSLIGFQSLINLGMNLRLLPVIGITLPFFSAGGSSVATLYLGIGLVLSVSFSRNSRRK